MDGGSFCVHKLVLDVWPAHGGNTLGLKRALSDDGRLCNRVSGGRSFGLTRNEIREALVHDLRPGCVEVLDMAHSLRRVKQFRRHVRNLCVYTVIRPPSVWLASVIELLGEGEVQNRWRLYQDYQSNQLANGQSASLRLRLHRSAEGIFNDLQLNLSRLPAHVQPRLGRPLPEWATPHLLARDLELERCISAYGATMETSRDGKMAETLGLARSSCVAMFKELIDGQLDASPAVSAPPPCSKASSHSSTTGPAQFVIITPCHNQEGTLRDTVQSVLRQHYTRWNMLILDDGTPEGTCHSLALKLGTLDRRILPPVLHTYPWGLSLTRNHGAALTRALGDHLVFLDADVSNSAACLCPLYPLQPWAALLRQSLCAKRLLLPPLTLPPRAGLAGPTFFE